MSRPQFRKRSLLAQAGLRFDPQALVPRYSGQTGKQITFSGSPAAFVRQGLRRRTPETDHQVVQYLIDLGILPARVEIARRQLEAAARLESYYPAARHGIR